MDFKNKLFKFAILVIVPINSLCVAITFHYNKERLMYLKQTTLYLDDLANEVKLFIITNENDPRILLEIQNCIEVKNFQIVSSGPLIHRFYLTWKHLEIFRTQYLSNSRISHFMYLEDDIQVKQENIVYWLKARNELKKFGLIPSFLHYEIYGNELNKRSCAVSKPVIFKKIPKVQINNYYWYLNMSQPYQAMYLLDRELAKEHLFDYPLEDRKSIWGIRETAASGLTFVNAPYGFSSRVVVGFNYEKFEIDAGALIHHLPNNYINRSFNEYGKIKIKDIVLRNKNLFSYAIDIKLVILHTIKIIKKIRGKIYYLTGK